MQAPTQQPVAISVEELNALLQQHSVMKQQIYQLKECLGKCESKWNKIVKNALRENVNLKDQNGRLKERIRLMEKQMDTTFSNG